MNKKNSLLLAAALLSGCASAVPPAPPAPPGPEILLLGEVHDNAAGHARRLALLEAKVEAGARPAIAMEQFDRERQADLDRAMGSCGDADCVIAAASAGARWNWPLYKPVIELALRYRLKLVAANLARADAGKVMRSGFGAALDPRTIARFGLDRPLPAALVAVQAQAIRTGHCNRLPEEMLEPMVRAQVARDVVMAQALAEHAVPGVVLLAGNGHVRRDAGVPLWLERQVSTRVVSIGYVESAGDGEYDEVVRVAPQPRPDPCAKR